MEPKALEDLNWNVGEAQFPNSNATKDVKHICKKLVQIDHDIHHMLLINYNKIQIIICNFYIFSVYS